MDAITIYFKPQKNISMTRQSFLAAETTVGETINNFVSRIQNLTEQCDYGEERKIK